MRPRSDLHESCGDLDIYLFDQLLRGRVAPGMRVLDADPDAIRAVQQRAAKLAPRLPPGRRHRLPDGSERYLVDAALLADLTHELGGELLDPLKTTIVQDQRCMTAWVVRKDV